MQNEPIFYASENPNPVMRVDLQGQIIYFNQASQAILNSWQYGNQLSPEAHDVMAMAIDKLQVCDMEVMVSDQHYLLRFCAFIERGYVNIYGFDISTRMAYKSELDQVSHYDQLTGLYNRKYFLENLSKCREYCLAHQKIGALLVIQIQKLTQLNQSLGHKHTDGILRELASRLSSCIPSTYLLARVGGNEFAVLREHVLDSTDAQNLAQVIIDNLSEPYLIDGDNVNVLSHIGVVVFPKEEKETLELITHAELAIEGITDTVQHTIKFYRQEMTIAASARNHLLRDLRYALEKEQLVTYFQPQVNLSDHSICGAEALVRWQHPEHGLLTPGRFTSLAEESGLIIGIGAWVLKDACRMMQKWHTFGHKDLVLAVNVSPKEFNNKNLVSSIKNTLNETGFPPEKLELEITESVLIDDIASAMTIFEELKKLGIKIAIDDFGTGFSSLSYLNQIPVDKIKIDQTFIEKISKDHNEHLIIDSIVDMGHKLNLKVIAEGIENYLHVTYLRRLHCDEAQGFYYSEPLSSESFQALLSIGFT